jgi:hypothetical protein
MFTVALYRIRLDWTMGPGLDADEYTWTFGVDAGSAPAASSLVSRFEAAWLFGANTNVRLRFALPSFLRTKAWSVYPAGGGGIISYHPDTSLFGAATSSQAPQVAIPVTPQITTSRGPANRSRWMIGPVTIGNTNGRPSLNHQTACLNFATEWHRQLVADGMTPVVLHAGGGSGSPILAYAVGDSYGSLRSRRYSLTTRTVVTP